MGGGVGILIIKAQFPGGQAVSHVVHEGNGHGAAAVGHHRLLGIVVRDRVRIGVLGHLGVIRLQHLGGPCGALSLAAPQEQQDHDDQQHQQHRRQNPHQILVVLLPGLGSVLPARPGGLLFLIVHVLYFLSRPSRRIGRSLRRHSIFSY